MMAAVWTWTEAEHEPNGRRGALVDGEGRMVAGADVVVSNRQGWCEDVRVWLFVAEYSLSGSCPHGQGIALAERLVATLRAQEEAELRGRMVAGDVAP